MSPEAPLLAWKSGDLVASISVARSVYSRRAVLATAYKLSGPLVVLPDADGPDRWVLHVVAETPGAAASAVPALIRELVDQALRDELETQFGELRNLVVAQAFSEGNLLDEARSKDDRHG